MNWKASNSNACAALVLEATFNQKSKLKLFALLFLPILCHHNALLNALPLIQKSRLAPSLDGDSWNAEVAMLALLLFPPAQSTHELHDLASSNMLYLVAGHAAVENHSTEHTTTHFHP